MYVCVYILYVLSVCTYRVYIYTYICRIIYKSHFGAISFDDGCFGDVPFLGALKGYLMVMNHERWKHQS